VNSIELTPKVVKMLELLRANPALAETVAEVLSVGVDPQAPGTINAAEERLVAPLRALALQVLRDWAEHAEEQAGLQLQAADPSARVRGKKTTWHCGYGTFEVTERVWRGQAGAWQRPFATSAALSARGSSRRLQRLASDFALEEPFGRAAARLLEHHGVTLAPSTVRALTLAHGHRAARAPARPALGAHAAARRGGDPHRGNRRHAAAAGGVCTRTR
jgi:hypothetical protein